MSDDGEDSGRAKGPQTVAEIVTKDLARRAEMFGKFAIRSEVFESFRKAASMAEMTALAARRLHEVGRAFHGFDKVVIPEGLVESATTAADMMTAPVTKQLQELGRSLRKMAMPDASILAGIEDRLALQGSLTDLVDVVVPEHDFEPLSLDKPTWEHQARLERATFETAEGTRELVELARAQHQEIAELRQLFGGVIGVLKHMDRDQQEADRRARRRDWLDIALTGLAAVAAVVAVIIAVRGGA